MVRAARAKRMQQNTNRLYGRYRRESARDPGAEERYSALMEKQQRRDNPNAELMHEEIATANARMRNKFDRIKTLKNLARSLKGRTHK